MTTNPKFRSDDKRTWRYGLNKENVQKIADSIPEKDIDSIVESLTRWLRK